MRSALKVTCTTSPKKTNAPVLEKLAITSFSLRTVGNLCAITNAYHTIKWHYRDALARSSMEDVAKITIYVLKAAIIRILGNMPADSTALAGDAAPPGELRHPPSLRDEVQVD